MRKLLALLLVVMIGIMSGGGCGSSKTSDIPNTAIVGAGAGGAVPAATAVPVTGTLGSVLIIKNAATGAELYRTSVSPFTYLADPTIQIKMEIYNDNDLTTPRSNITVTPAADKAVVCNFATSDFVAVTDYNAATNTITEPTTNTPIVTCATGTTTKTVTTTEIAASATTIQTHSDATAGLDANTVTTALTTATPDATIITASEGATTGSIAFTVVLPNTTSGTVTFNFTSAVTLPTTSNTALKFTAKMSNSTGSAIGYAKMYYANSKVMIETSKDGTNWNAAKEITTVTQTSGKLSSATLAITSGTPASIFTEGTDFMTTNVTGKKIVPGTYKVSLEADLLGTAIKSSFGPQTITVN